MGTILSFMPRQAAQGRPQTNGGPNTGRVEAAVIIFPGVRYERPGEGNAHSQMARAARQRPTPNKTGQHH